MSIHNPEGTFWIIHPFDSCKKEFPTEQEANEQAERLAGKEPHKRFYVARIVGMWYYPTRQPSHVSFLPAPEPSGPSYEPKD